MRLSRSIRNLGVFGLDVYAALSILQIIRFVYQEIGIAGEGVSVRAPLLWTHADFSGYSGFALYTIIFKALPVFCVCMAVRRLTNVLVGMPSLPLRDFASLFVPAAVLFFANEFVALASQAGTTMVSSFADVIWLAAFAVHRLALPVMVAVVARRGFRGTSWTLWLLPFVASLTVIAALIGKYRTWPELGFPLQFKLIAFYAACWAAASALLAFECARWRKNLVKYPA